MVYPSKMEEYVEKLHSKYYRYIASITRNTKFQIDIIKKDKIIVDI